MSNHKEHNLSYWKKRVRRSQEGLKKSLDAFQKRVEPQLPEILKGRFGGPIEAAHIAQESQKLRRQVERNTLPDEDLLRSHVLSAFPDASPEKKEKAFLIRKTDALERAAVAVRAKFREKKAR